MEKPDNEAWAKGSDVIELLAYMLAFPKLDHSTAVSAVLTDNSLRAAHSIGLLRASSNINFKQPRWQASYTRNKAVAYHTWLFHFLGGTKMKIISPPNFVTVDSARFSLQLRTDALRFESDYKSEVERLIKAVKRGTHGAQEELDALRSALVPLELLRLSVAMPTDAVLAAGGGGDDPVDPATQERAERRASVAWVLACGTHARGGRNCPFRKLVGAHTALLCLKIADASVVDIPTWPHQTEVS